MMESTETNLRRDIERGNGAALWDSLNVYADWLEERGDPIAAGFRLLARGERAPLVGEDVLGYCTGVFINWAPTREQGNGSEALPNSVFERLKHPQDIAYGSGYISQMNAFVDAAQAYVAAIDDGELDAADYI